MRAGRCFALPTRLKMLQRGTTAALLLPLVNYTLAAGSCIADMSPDCVLAQPTFTHRLCSSSSKGVTTALPPSGHLEEQHCLDLPPLQHLPGERRGRYVLVCTAYLLGCKSWHIVTAKQPPTFILAQKQLVSLQRLVKSCW